MIDVCLVIPTIRENCFRDFCERWGNLGLFEHVQLLVMEDNPTKTFDVEKLIEKFTHFKAIHLCWEDIDSDPEFMSPIIPRRSDTVRSYGYYYAWKQREYKFILTLDDDCYPCDEEDGITYNGQGFVEEHKKWLTRRSRWFNTLSSTIPRGIPYFNKGTSDRNMINHGLWTNVLDYDAPRQLVNPEKEKFNYQNVIVPQGSYFPMCGMNVMWKSEATVLMYHLLMGQMRRNDPASPDADAPVLEKLPFDRFGDIWCGIIAKKICDLFGLNMSSGLPYIHHERASNPFTNLKKEANGIEVNEKFWEHIDRFSLEWRHDPSHDLEHSLATCYQEMGKHVRNFKEFPEHEKYFRELGTAMELWARAFIVGIEAQGDMKAEAK